MALQQVLLLDSLLSCLCQITVITNIPWDDDYQFDSNKINGWEIYHSTNPPVTKTFYVPFNRLFTVNNTNYHGGYFYTNGGSRTWMHRYFQCSTPSMIEVTYEWGSCNSDSSDTIAVYKINDISTYAQSNSMKDTGSDITDTALLNYLQNNFYNTMWVTDKINNWVNIMPNNDTYVDAYETFEIIFTQGLDLWDEFGYITNIRIQCVAQSTSNPTSSPSTLYPTTSQLTTSNPTSLYPTFHPTNNPTSVPTTPQPTTSNPTSMIPTTSQPTTSTPTSLYPTSNPSNSPMISPTISDLTTSAPSFTAPTTIAPTTTTLIAISTTEDLRAVDRKQEPTNINTMVKIIIGGLVSILFLVVIVLIVILLRNNLQKKRKKIEMSLAQNYTNKNSQIMKKIEMSSNNQSVDSLDKNRNNFDNIQRNDIVGNIGESMTSDAQNNICSSEGIDNIEEIYNSGEEEIYTSPTVGAETTTHTGGDV